jgi:dihydrolipoamide dehydrogenase
LGSDVTVVEIMDRVLPVEDEEISAMAAKAFKSQGMTIMTGVSVEKLASAPGHVTASIRQADGAMLERNFDKVILAVGITPNTENLGLGELGVKLDRGHVLTDEWCRTNVPGLYAIGDITAPPWLAHKASHEAILCVEKIAGEADVHLLDPLNIPGCTYCTPQVASIGLTEEKARAGGRKLRIGRFPFQANGKAIALGETGGMVKTIFDAETGELLGAHMIGAEVTELIEGYAIAKSGELTEKELMHTVFAHPTLSEMMHEAVLDAYDRVIHT